jgi:hypothetical protein
VKETTIHHSVMLSIKKFTIYVELQPIAETLTHTHTPREREGNEWKELKLDNTSITEKHSLGIVTFQRALELCYPPLTLNQKQMSSYTPPLSSVPGSEA